MTLLCVEYTHFAGAVTWPLAFNSSKNASGLPDELNPHMYVRTVLNPTPDFDLYHALWLPGQHTIVSWIPTPTVAAAVNAHPGDREFHSLL